MIFIVMTVTIITLQKANICLLGKLAMASSASTPPRKPSFSCSSRTWSSVITVRRLAGALSDHHALRSDFHIEMAVRIFVAVVPVTLDIGFKYWVFNKLRKISPLTTILGEYATERCSIRAIAHTHDRTTHLHAFWCALAARNYLARAKRDVDGLAKRLRKSVEKK